MPREIDLWEEYQLGLIMDMESEFKLNKELDFSFVFNACRQSFNAGQDLNPKLYTKEELQEAVKQEREAWVKKILDCYTIEELEKAISKKGEV